MPGCLLRLPIKSCYIDAVGNAFSPVIRCQARNARPLVTWQSWCKTKGTRRTYSIHTCTGRRLNCHFACRTFTGENKIFPRLGGTPQDISILLLCKGSYQLWGIWGLLQPPSNPKALPMVFLLRPIGMTFTLWRFFKGAKICIRSLEAYISRADEGGGLITSMEIIHCSGQPWTTMVDFKSLFLQSRFHLENHCGSDNRL